MRGGDDGFKGVRLRVTLIRAVDAFLKTQASCEQGYRSRADFIDRAVRDKLREFTTVEPPRFEHINTYEDHVSILDRHLKTELAVYFKDDGTAWCEHDESNDCVHIDYALSLDDVRQALAKHDWKRTRTS